MLNILKELVVNPKQGLFYYENGNHNYVVVYLTNGGRLAAHSFFSEEKALFFAEQTSGVIMQRRG